MKMSYQHDVDNKSLSLHGTLPKYKAIYVRYLAILCHPVCAIEMYVNRQNLRRLQTKYVLLHVQPFQFIVIS